MTTSAQTLAAFTEAAAARSVEWVTKLDTFGVAPRSTLRLARHQFNAVADKATIPAVVTEDRLWSAVFATGKIVAGRKVPGVATIDRRDRPAGLTHLTITLPCPFTAQELVKALRDARDAQCEAALKRYTTERATILARIEGLP